ncbi:hypothetical protein Ddye_006796 [Dipteronia dyeriana]|uniref:BHLH domain-containing protein n=1 Tax=Dipteronia dyeriana TaxID=168575 RepID=A0AAD9XJQ6_9ROSI|nr:hypothetical protein Ddye_006796 [Dipteronia dyeriana]
MLGNHSCVDKCSEEEMQQQSNNISSANIPTTHDQRVLETAELAKVGQKRRRKDGKFVGGGDGGNGGVSVHEMHMLIERERRIKMRNMFSSLHALLPQLPPKADKSTIVNEAVKYIKTLQHTVQTLKKQRHDKLQNVTAPVADSEYESIITSSNVQQPIDSREAFFSNHHQGPVPPLSSKNLSMATNVPLPVHPFQVPAPPVCFQTWLSPNVVVNVCGDDAQISVCSPRKPGLLSTIFYILEKYNLDVVSAHVTSDSYRRMYMIQAHAGGASNQFPEALPVEETFKLAVGEMNLWILTC